MSGLIIKSSWAIISLSIMNMTRILEYIKYNITFFKYLIHVLASLRHTLWKKFGFLICLFRFFLVRLWSCDRASLLEINSIEAMLNDEQEKRQIVVDEIIRPDKTNQCKRTRNIQTATSNGNEFYNCWTVLWCWINKLQTGWLQWRYWCM